MARTSNQTENCVYWDCETHPDLSGWYFGTLAVVIAFDILTLLSFLLAKRSRSLQRQSKTLHLPRSGCPSCGGPVSPPPSGQSFCRLCCLLNPVPFFSLIFGMAQIMIILFSSQGSYPEKDSCLILGTVMILLDFPNFLVCSWFWLKANQTQTSAELSDDIALTNMSSDPQPVENWEPIDPHPVPLLNSIPLHQDELVYYYQERSRCSTHPDAIILQSFIIASYVLLFPSIVLLVSGPLPCLFAVVVAMTSLMPVYLALASPSHLIVTNLRAISIQNSTLFPWSRICWLSKIHSLGVIESDPSSPAPQLLDLLLYDLWQTPLSLFKCAPAVRDADLQDDTSLVPSNHSWLTSSSTPLTRINIDGERFDGFDDLLTAAQIIDSFRGNNCEPAPKIKPRPPKRWLILLFWFSKWALLIVYIPVIYIVDITVKIFFPALLITNFLLPTLAMGFIDNVSRTLTVFKSQSIYQRS